MNDRKGKRVALLSVIVGVLVIVVLPLVFRDSLTKLLSSSEENSSLTSQDQLPRSPSYSGQRVDIASGSIGINEFSRFLADWTGLSALVDSGISQKQIVVSSNIVNADADIIRAILVSNGCVAQREKLPNGRQVLRIRSAKN